MGDASVDRIDLEEIRWPDSGQPRGKFHKGGEFHNHLSGYWLLKILLDCGSHLVI